MSFFGRLRKRVRAAAARSRLEREMQEEMNAHIAQAVERFRARGMAEVEAQLAARREFGNVGVLQEQARDARTVRWLESALGDLRYAVRQFARSPLLATTIVVTLTVGIGMSSAGFSIVSGYLTRPAPGVPDDRSLVAIRGINLTDGNRFGRAMSYPELVELSRLPEFREVAGWSPSVAVMEVDGEDAGSAFVQFVTPNFFRALGIEVSPGRSFVQGASRDRAPEMTAVISHRFAAERFGEAAAAVGRTIRVNGINITIVGVAPSRFLSAVGSGESRTLWIPVGAWPVIDRIPGDAFTRRTDGSFLTFGRLRQGVSLDQASSAVSTVATQSAAAMPTTSPRGNRLRPSIFSADVVPLRGDVSLSNGDTTELVAMVSVLAILILLVCTTTVSSLLVGAAVSRRHEIAVRLALGASRARIVRQLLTESALLSLVAGGAGLLVFVAVSRALRNQITDVDLDPTWTTALATTLCALLTAVLCGLSPALHVTRDGVAGVLKDSSATATIKSRLQRLFVVAQTALTQPLLVGLAMTIAIVVRETGPRETKDLRERLVRAEFDTWSPAARSENRLSAVVDRLSALPGVIKVIPQSGSYAIMKIETFPAGAEPARRFRIRTQEVPAGYFTAMDIRMLRGREFIDEDSMLTVRPVVIGADLARQAFGSEDPIGKRLATLTYEQERRTSDQMQVVGVVAVEDVGQSQMGSQLRIFTPMVGWRRAGPNVGGLLIRTAGPATPLLKTFSEIARAEAPMTPLRTMKTVAEIDRETRSEVTEAASAAAAAGLLALFLASIGLYAVVALSVSQRRREIGVRLSLGAAPGEVVAMFFRSGVKISAIGLLIGMPLAIAAMKLLSQMMAMPKVSMTAIAAVVALAVILVASLASWIPARRAAGVDPLVALRDG